MTKTELPDLYTQKDVERARTKGELVGLVKGVAVGVTGFVLLGVIGWIPTLAVVGVGGLVLWKVFSGPPKSSD
jgi:MFS superfamily sulfate permease-like transporter